MCASNMGNLSHEFSSIDPWEACVCMSGRFSFLFCFVFYFLCVFW